MAWRTWRRMKEGRIMELSETLRGRGYSSLRYWEGLGGWERESLKVPALG